MCPAVFDRVRKHCVVLKVKTVFLYSFLGVELFLVLKDSTLKPLLAHRQMYWVLLKTVFSPKGVCFLLLDLLIVGFPRSVKPVAFLVPIYGYVL